MRVRALAPTVLFAAPLTLLPPRHANADSQAKDEPGDRVPGSPRQSAREDASSVTVVLIGAVGESTKLRGLLVELLERQGVHPELEREPHFVPAHLLSGDESDRAAWVFVELVDQHAARLYFRGPHAERFLLRDLELRDGLDDLGCELIAQVVESSVVSILRSSAGISREQARAVLAERNGSSAPTADEHEAPVLPRTGRAKLGAWLGVRYAGQWTGSDLGGAHGPGGELGIEWRSRAIFRGSLSAERWFAQAFVSPQIRANIQSWPLRLSIDVGRSAGSAQSWLFGVAAGVDVTRVEPGQNLDPTVTPTTARTRVVPVLRTAARYELGLGGWRMGLTAFADISPLDTHYDLQDKSGTAQRVVAPWRVRPGLALVLAWCPSLGTP